MNKYFEEIPYIRAIACMMVVLVHISAISHSNSFFADNWSLYINQISRVGTPIFAVISAFLLFNSIKDKKLNLKRFFKSRTTKIVLPFIIWTIVYLAVKSYLGKDVFSNMGQVINYFLLGTSHYHLYFIITVIQFYIIFPILQLPKNRIVILVMFLLSIPLNFYWYNIDNFTFDNTIINSILNHRSFILNWIAYFMFGAVLVYFYKELISFTYKARYLIFSAFILMMFMMVNEITHGVVLTSSREENLFYVPIVILFLLTTFNYIKNFNRTVNVITLIGNYSMGIYLIHPLIIIFLRETFALYPLVSYQLIIVFMVVLTLSILITQLILFIPLSKYIIPVGKKKKSITPKINVKEVI
ncbi:acyltransferase [Oceanobacillus sp. 1P07AA]|uniref:acyltransferase n=1 Tax=Oceanobacillus sp. 1P07AA TaxID=3132293 RepID=UPI0039A416BE